VNGPEDSRLLDAAEAMVRGDDVAWQDVDAGGDAATSRALRELQVVEQIAAFHRTFGGSDEHTVTSVTPEAERTALHTWGHLTLRERIDKGSFGSVYRAHDPKLQTDVALKLVPVGDLSIVDSGRALKEARLLARVRHANVVRVHGADVIDGHVGIWMEHVEGQTLSALLRVQGPLGAREAAVIGADLCQALAAVHAAGLIHGDVKARNIMREAGGRTVLMDFGTGKEVSLSTSRPRGTDLAGTPLYLAPEVFRGEQRSKQNDVYGLGVLLFHLVTNDYPVAGSTQADVQEAHRQGARRRLRDVRPDLPATFVDAVERATAADMRERFQSVGELEAALLGFLGRTKEPAPSFFSVGRLVIAAVTLTAVLIAAWYWAGRQRSAATIPASAPAPAAAVTSAATPAAYQIETAMHRRSSGTSVRLRAGDRVEPGDELFATLRVSSPTYVYIVNEDDRGEAFLLFPLPGQAVDNPIAPGKVVRIPGTRQADTTWQITSAGGREHFLIFASPERLSAFEDLFGELPRPAFGKPIASSKLPDSVLGRLRGVGGLKASSADAAGPRLAGIFTSPLGEAEETARGLWVRKLTVENPPKP